MSKLETDDLSFRDRSDPIDCENTYKGSNRKVSSYINVLSFEILTNLYFFKSLLVNKYVVK
jgi:hypothetical protein